MAHSTFTYRETVVDCQTCDEPFHPNYASCVRCGTPPGQPPVAPGVPTYPVSGVGTAAVVLVAATATAFTALGLLYPPIAAALAQRARDDLDIAPLNLAAGLGLLFAVVWLLLMLSAAVLTITWLWRARKNLDAFPGAKRTMAAGWAIGGWFIPFANLVIPVRVADNVARASLWQLRTHPRRANRLVMTWWGSFIAGVVIDRIMGATSDPLPLALTSVADFQRHVDFYQGAAAANLPAVLLSIIAAVAFGMLVVRINRAQGARLARSHLRTAPTSPGQPLAAQPPRPGTHPATPTVGG